MIDLIILDCHQLYDPANAKELGKFKDEAEGVAIAEVVCVSAEMYCLRSTTLDCDTAEININKCKGISKSVVKKEERNWDLCQCSANR